MMNDDCLWAEIETAFDELAASKRVAKSIDFDVLMDSPDELWENPDTSELENYLYEKMQGR